MNQSPRKGFSVQGLVQHRPIGCAPRRGRLELLAARSPVCCKAAAFDSDDYELTEADGYDSDDYEPFVGPAPRTAAQTSSAAGPPSVSHRQEAGKFVYSSSVAAKSESARPRRQHKRAKAALSNGFNLFLLFGAAVDRFVSRIQAALLTAARAGQRKAQAAQSGAEESLRASRVGRSIESWQQSAREVQRELPEDLWGKLLWLWDRPPVQRLRLTVSMANLSIRLPAILALVATQVGLLASQVSLPMLAPLLLGTGMLLRSIKTNASFLFPRIGLLVVMLWLLWFANSVVQNTTAYLRKQGAIDQRLAGGIITVSECSALLVAMVVMLSMLGVNVSALLLPAGVAVAVAAKDLMHNFLAGFFLFVVQPFKLGDRVAVSSSAPGVPGSMAGAWFEGVAEKVDLRYTMIRQGRRRLMVPNSAFLTREFMVLEEPSAGEGPVPPPPGEQQYQQFMTNDHRHVWQYVEGPPLHRELAGAAVAGSAGGTGGPKPAPGEEQEAGEGGALRQPQRDHPQQQQQQYHPQQQPQQAVQGGAVPFIPPQQQAVPNGVGGGGSGSGHSLDRSGVGAAPNGQYYYGSTGFNGGSAYYQPLQGAYPRPPGSTPQYNSSMGGPASYPLDPEAWQQYQGPSAGTPQQP